MYTFLLSTTELSFPIAICLYTARASGFCTFIPKKSSVPQKKVRVYKKMPVWSFCVPVKKLVSGSTFIEFETYKKNVLNTSWHIPSIIVLNSYIIKYDGIKNVACSQFRLKYIKNNTTKDLMEKWPFYKQPSGYRLVIDTLLEKWERSFNSILSFLSKENHVKDRNVKKFIDSLKTDIGISENGRDAALILALHGYFVPTNKIIRIDPKTNKKVTTKFTIKDSQESVIFVGETKQAIEDHIEHIRKTKISVQPSLYCVGEDIFTVKDIFLHIEGVRYNFKSIRYLF
ncbi:hypothetical protein QTP88_010885 [Uroleucon formosanum]